MNSITKLSKKYFITYLISGSIGLVSVMNADNGQPVFWIPCGIGTMVALVSMILSILKRRQIDAIERTERSGKSTEGTQRSGFTNV